MIDKNQLLWLVVDFHVLINFLKFPNFFIYEHLSNISFWNCSRHHFLTSLLRSTWEKTVRDASKWSASLLLDLRKQWEVFGYLRQDAGVWGVEARGLQLPSPVPPPFEALNDGHLAPYLGCEEGKEGARSGRSTGGGGDLPRLGEEGWPGKPSGTVRSHGGLGGSALGPACRAGVSAAGHSRRRCPGRLCTRCSGEPLELGKPAPSQAAPITSSCFCLAPRGSVCPNPRPLPGLDILPPLPPFSRLPPPSKFRHDPGYSSRWRSHARRFWAPEWGHWGREHEDEPEGPGSFEPTQGGWRKALGRWD